MNKSNKLLISALLVGVLGSLVALGVFGLFSATTQNAGNEISSGTVLISDNDAGSAQFNVTNAKPGESWERCIKVTYNGSLPADVHLYMTGGGGALEPYLHLTLSQGTQASPTFPSCAGFTPDNTNGTGVLYDGAAAGLLGSDYETGLTVVPFGQESWASGSALVFKERLALSAEAPDTAQGATTGVFTLFAEARNHA
ncbi:MAG TPA: hypothetical protein VHA80_04205 [Solirubrobacterales bacterium]|nr:hypothetical protein [Solirubrobacterales bacterium]